MTVSTYTEKKFLRKYEKKVEAHMLVPFQKILELLRPIKGKRVLDIGSGSGELTSELAKMSGKVIGVDKSRQWIKHCKKYKFPNLSFVQADATKLPFKSASFDAIVMNMVLLNVATLREIGMILKEASRLLRPNGIFLFSDLHPICVMTPKVPPTRYQKYSKNFSYFRDGTEYVAGIRLSKGEKMEFFNKHWTLETYTDLLRKHGLYVYKIAEPTYGKSAPNLLRKFRVPEYILFGCKKLKR